MKGLFDAYDAGGETALILDSNGNVTEGPGFNVFVVKDGCLRSPAYGVLPGITRRSVFDLAQETNLRAVAEDVSRMELAAADEVFITSTAGGMMPVTRVDSAPIADGTVGPVTRLLMNLYWQKHSDPEWSTPVS